VRVVRKGRIILGQDDLFGLGYDLLRRVRLAYHVPTLRFELKCLALKFRINQDIGLYFIIHWIYLSDRRSMIIY
jgi:hypothetical protein